VPRNPSELQRLEEELHHWKQQLRYGIHSKATKEYILGELRSVAKTLGVSVPNYNSTEFWEFLAS
jgi:hypothetical protein